MSNFSYEKLIETIITLITTTTESQDVKKGKVSVEALLQKFNSDEFKDQLKDQLKQGMPKQKRGSTDELKDENAPKKNKNAYMFFCDKKRPEIKAAQSELKATEVMKVLGERWKSSTPETKAKYSKKAEYKRPSDEELMKQKINQKKKRGKPSSGEKKKRSKKPEGAPTRGKSAYLFFCQANRPEVKEANPSFKATELMAELGRMWKELPDDEKVEFEEQAAEAKEKYLQEKTEWEEKTGLELSPKKPKSKAKPKAKADEEPQSPEPESPKPKSKKSKSEPQSEESEAEAESPKPKSKKFGSEPVSPAPQKKDSKKKVSVSSSDEEDN